MTPLMISETECPKQQGDNILPCHGVTVSLALYDVQADTDGLPKPVYQLEVAVWAVTPVMGEVIKTQLHHALTFNLEEATADFTLMAEYYSATHQFTDTEIEARTHGQYS